MDYNLLFKSVFDHTENAVIICDANKRIIDVNVNFTFITGYEKSFCIGKDPKFLSAGEQGPGIYIEMWDSIRTTGCWHGKLWNRRKNGTKYVEKITIQTIYDTDGEVSGYVGIFTEGTRDKISLDRIRDSANYDALTKLYNKNYFDMCVDLYDENHKSRGDNFALLYVDIDSFSKLNTFYGYATGNMILAEIANRINQFIGQSDFAGYISTDIFGVTLGNIIGNNDASTKAAELHRLLSSPININNTNIPITIHMGMATTESDDDDEYLSIDQRATEALKEAKLSKAKQCKVYDTQVHNKSIREAIIFSSLEHAIENNQLSLVFQPIIDMHYDNTLLLEALIRWQHPKLGNVSPIEFIPIAEKSGFINRIGKFIIEESCKQITEWKTLTSKKITVNVNLSTVEFLNRDVTEHLFSMCEKYQIQPDNLGIEITENQDFSQVLGFKPILEKARSLGFNVSIDDFGTGYSSFSYLHDVPCDKLKIDKAFIDRLGHDLKGTILTQSIINMAHMMDLTVVAEGVGTLQQLDLLKSMRCDYVQGYFLGKPMAAETISATFFDQYPEPHLISA